MRLPVPGIRVLLPCAPTPQLVYLIRITKVCFKTTGGRKLFPGDTLVIGGNPLIWCGNQMHFPYNDDEELAELAFTENGDPTLVAPYFEVIKALKSLALRIMEDAIPVQ